MSSKKHFILRREICLSLASSPCWQLQGGSIRRCPHRPASPNLTWRSVGLPLRADKQLGGIVANHGSIGTTDLPRDSCCTVSGWAVVTENLVCMPAVVTENLVCMPTLSAGETDQGNRAAMQRRSGSQSGECIEKSGSARDEIALVRKTNGSYRRRGPTEIKRRGVGIGDEVLRPEESLRCARVLASPRLSIPEHLWPAPNEFGSPGSRQNNFAESGATIFHSTR